MHTHSTLLLAILFFIAHAEGTGGWTSIWVFFFFFFLLHSSVIGRLLIPWEPLFCRSQQGHLLVPRPSFYKPAARWPRYCPSIQTPFLPSLTAAV